MRGRKHSEDVATEPYAARVDDANETKPSSRKKTFSANLCSQNWWRYIFGKILSYNLKTGSPSDTSRSFTLSPTDAYSPSAGHFKMASVIEVVITINEAAKTATAKSYEFQWIPSGKDEGKKA